MVETPAMDEFLVSIFHLKYVIDDIGGNNDEHRLYVFHTPGKKIIKHYHKLVLEIEFTQKSGEIQKTLRSETEII